MGVFHEERTARTSEEEEALRAEEDALEEYQATEEFIQQPKQVFKNMLENYHFQKGKLYQFGKFHHYSK